MSDYMTMAYRLCKLLTWMTVVTAAAAGIYGKVTQMQHHPNNIISTDDVIFAEDKSGFAFASYYQSRMVLQRAPQQPVVWGYAPLTAMGRQVTVKVMGNATQTYSATVKKGPFSRQAVWSVTLAPESGTSTFIITAGLEKYNLLVLRDVLFGDVWLCSGQSNMALSLSVIFGYERIKMESYKYDQVRLFNIGRVTSAKPLYDLEKIVQPWAAPKDAIGFGEFSAVCYLYGQRLYEKLGYPIGLVETTWGGTPVESWSTPASLASCGIHYTQIPDYDYVRMYYAANISTIPIDHRVPNQVSGLWNAMIHPFLNLTIKGAIWYQGEANTNMNTNLYNCTFPAMIKAWRSGFNQGTGGQVPLNMPFGFVQIGPINGLGNLFGYPIIRWHQMKDDVTGLKLEKTFMAVAMDLTDPIGSVHYRDKQTVAERLTRAALSVVYKQGPALNMFPYPTSEKLNSHNHTLVLEFLFGKVNINVRSKDGFEVCCAADYFMCSMNSTTNWVPSPIAHYTGTTVTLSLNACHSSTVAAYRYEWRASPCPYHMCAVYSDLSGDPLPTFTRRLTTS